MSDETGSQQNNATMDFAELMQNSGVVPIKNQQQIHAKPIKKSKPSPPYYGQTQNTHKTATIGTQMSNSAFSNHCEMKTLSAADTLNFCSKNIQKNAFRKLRRGQFPIADELDLHGLTSLQARELLLDFLKHVTIPSRHCVHIIHGKGHRSADNKAILKTKVNHWLQQHPRVLAFHSCLPADGGTGAVYVIIRLK